MAFPTSPTNGQQVTLNYVTYQYDSTNTAWYRVSTTVAEPIASLAYTQANSAFAQANAAFAQANTGGGGGASLGAIITTTQGWNLP